jgi:Helicase HerA, central domain
MSDAAGHRLVAIPGPRPNSEGKTSVRPPLMLPPGLEWWLELHRAAEGSVCCCLGAPSAWTLTSVATALGEVVPGIELTTATECPVGPAYLSHGTLLRAKAVVPTHFWPMQLRGGFDRAGPLLRLLGSPQLAGQEVLLQLLFRTPGIWERRLFGASYESFLAGIDQRQRSLFDRRMADLPVHVEIRAAFLGSHDWLAAKAVDQWAASWMSMHGSPQWQFVWVRGRRRRERFLQSMRDHDLRHFAGKKGRRDISATEVSAILPIPWRERHPNLTYVGAPTGRAPTPLVADPRRPSEVIVGSSGADLVRLPPNWHHLAIVGRTRSGKSTLAQNIALQILRSQPGVKVVVLEPTGELIRDLVDRLPAQVAGGTLAIDPAHPTDVQDGHTLARVPLNLLGLDDRPKVGTPEFERQAEQVSGGLVQAIKNAWGEESVGGRADFILRSVFQALLTLEGTNLVDAYSALSDKETLRRLERLVPEGPLRQALRTHVPRLDYAFTISSLDKVGKVATNPVLRKALCQRYHPVSFDQLLDHQLVLLDLAKGALGTEGANFLGAIYLTQLWSALQRRVRKDWPVYLIVDEFHNFAIPAFADMLSEGARLGLHVVAVTQYLNRIPDRIRSALIGNVDAWMLFSLGTEDMNEGWKLVQGDQFGWTPDHLVSGLAPHEVAMAVRGSLLRVATSPPAPPNESVENTRRAVQMSSRRYARPEDSEASPLALSSERIATFLRVLPELDGREVRQLTKELGWPRGEVEAAIARCKAVGDVAAAGAGIVGLTRRGSFHRQAIDAARNEGEEHTDLLTDAAMFLDAKGVRVRIVEQGGGYLVPDAEFEVGGRTYNVEVECSTLVKHLDQVARNIRKAAGSGRRCLVVVSSPAMAERFVQILELGTGGGTLWGEVGLLSRSLSGQLLPFENGVTRPWGWLVGREDEPATPAFPAPHVEVQQKFEPVATSDVERALSLALRLLASGKGEATAEEFVLMGEPDEELLTDLLRLGMALRTLGIPSHRIRRNGGQTRVYQLDSLRTGSVARLATENVDSGTRAA